MVYHTCIEAQEDLIKDSYNTLERTLSYTNDDQVVLTESLTDFLSSMKKFVNMIIEKIIGYWHKLVDFISKILTKIKVFSRSKISKNVRLNKINIPFINNFNRVDYKEYNDFDDVIKEFRDATAFLNTEINNSIKENERIFNKIKRFNIAYEQSEIIEEKVSYPDQNVHTIEYPEDYGIDDDIKYTTQGVFQDKSFIDNLQNETMKALTINDLIKIKNAQKDILELYNMLKQRSTRRLRDYLNSRKYRRLDEYHGTTFGCKNTQAQFLTYYLNNTDIDFCESFEENGFPIFKGTDKEKSKQIQIWANLALNKNRAIIETLQNMIELNAKAFNISKEEALKISKKLATNDFTDFNKIFTAITTDKNGKKIRIIDRYLNKDRNIIDFSPLKLGQIIFSQRIYDAGLIDLLMDVDYCKKIYNYITRYDIVIYAHGDKHITTFVDWLRILRNVNNTEYETFLSLYYNYIKAITRYYNKPIECISSEEEINFNKLIKLNRYTFKDKNNPDLKRSINGLKFREIVKESAIIGKRWICDEVYLPGCSQPFQDIELIIKYLADNFKYKRILILACNPGRYVLTPSIRNSRNIHVIHSPLNEIT